MQFWLIPGVSRILTEDAHFTQVGLGFDLLP